MTILLISIILNHLNLFLPGEGTPGLRKLLPLLKRFHVVAPSIPGYGWSEAPKTPGASVPWMSGADAPRDAVHPEVLVDLG